MPLTDLFAPLSQAEWDELDQFLLHKASQDSMMLDTLDGFLTAVVIGPAFVSVSLWLPVVWGGQSNEPAFQNPQEAQRILELMLRHMNYIAWTFTDDADEFEPIMGSIHYPDQRRKREYVTGEGWAMGFMDGVALCRPEWEPLFKSNAAMLALRPIHLLGSLDAPVMSTHDLYIVFIVITKLRLQKLRQPLKPHDFDKVAAEIEFLVV